uniref:protachykinin-like isoform X1 n=1 Tax=Scatophagus argus TaxID=75038 RepID=UPI001ED803C8|nr:protachykinin-like isoform X1 [Scatophagus argus]
MVKRPPWRRGASERKTRRYLLPFSVKIIQQRRADYLHTLELLLTNVFCQEVDADSWREGIQENERPNCEVIQDILVRMTGKPGLGRHLALMGNKASAKSQTARKRHKFHTFVGLMGKRSFGNRGAP